MRLTIIGTGYVGLVAGACLASLGNDVICVDIDEEKINHLNEGVIPIYEPGLRDLIEMNTKEHRMEFTTDIKKAVKKSDVIFIAVGTPSGSDGKADLSAVYAVAADIGRYMNGYKVIVDKSTVPVGTADKVKEIIAENQESAMEFDLVSNPEFLREGEAIKDFMTPDRVVIGTESDKSRDIMLDIYRGIERTGKPIMITSIKSAEMIKYASNAFLATKISFMNEIARICEKVGGDVKDVARGMGLDSRIGPRFLQAGVGYGGSCFPKDVRAIINTAREAGLDFRILNAVDSINEEQKTLLLPKIKKLVPDLKGVSVAVWGLSFKPKTDDMREAPSIVVINQLLAEGAMVKAFDPVAQKVAKKLLPDIHYSNSPFNALKDADLLVIVTEWDEFRYLDKEKIKKYMNKPNVVDGRNVWEPSEMKALGFNYIGVGR
ncbi:UDP-glucose/GDP-mannose dehydrogenase family protein [Candidatus Woesearchaeota archaeon]|nr:UDP-glucose/GDP-mannose dehydrogenase family protein [Candidatus Woesearchaeota archaeon]